MTAGPAQHLRLPTTASTRWIPLRLGLVDLFHYDYQEFWFRDGRLMLRGNNGTGKSKVLALTLPFLLDGDVSAHRVEPDGDPRKRMEWNLLLDGAHEERLGYTWMELGRRTEDGEHAYVTIGCGLKAARGRGIADRWFFLTSQRVGEELFLISPTGTALTRDRLEAAIGLSGQVLRTAEQYRRLVDEHLFHLGADRYDALVDLLIQLRQPQLSKRPDEAKLSRALSEALPPVDQAVLADIAAALHDLEQQREELGALRETRTHVQRFLGRYTTYARVAARRQGRIVRQAQSGYEEVGRSLLAVRGEIEGHRGRRDEIEVGVSAAKVRLVELRAAREELATRPEVKDLEAAGRMAEETRRASDAAREQVSDAQRLRQDRAAKLDRAESEVREAVSAWQAQQENAASLAGTVGLGALHAEQAGGLAGAGGLAEAAGREPDLGSGPGAGSEQQAVDHDQDEAHRSAGEADRDLAFAGLAATAEQELGDAIRRRTEGCRHLTALIREAIRAGQALAEERRRLGDREADLDRARDLASAASDALDQAADALVQRWSGYLGTLTELDGGHPEDHDLAGWGRTPEGHNPSVAALQDAAAAAHAVLADLIAAAQGRSDAARAELADLRSEQQALERGVTAAPPPRHTREIDDRVGRPGAPLWQLVDFAEGLPDAERAGIEAALEASGLLDAWVTPDGRLLDVPGDVVLLAGDRADPHLGEVLHPAGDVPPGDHPPPPDVLSRILAGIGLREARSATPSGPAGHAGRPDAEPATWIGRDGSFRIGPLEGSWQKDAAVYVGHAAREAARRRRLAELGALVGATLTRLAELDAAQQALAGRRTRLQAEATGHPGDGTVRDAYSALIQARRETAHHEEQVSLRQRAVALAAGTLDAAAQERDEAAEDLSLPADEEALGAVREALGHYDQSLARLFAQARGVMAATRERRTWRAELDAARARLRRAEQDAGQARDRHTEAAARLATLEAAIGGTVMELKERLERTHRELAELGPELERRQTALDDAREQLARARGLEEGLLAQQTERSARRDDAVRAFLGFAGTGLLMVAVPDLELPESPSVWAADPTVRLARRLEQELADVDDGDPAWKRVQDDITRQFTALSEALSRHGHRAMAELREDRYVVTITFQGRDRAPGELVGLLDGEVGYRERILSAKERELLEEHLVNDVAGHLQELITEAEEQVGQMNAELRERPTSTGMLVRLRWEVQPDGPDGLAEARARLLRQTSDLWSIEDRAAVGAFLAQQIERERAADEFGTWQEHLSRALDYRAWHRFVIERFQDGRWRPASGPASGGERVLTVSLPLFAAASAHYRSAHPHAPRLVLLDEAFAGVDDQARAACLGLLATFDLDVVMTSEREWGFYSTVPGIATHQLVRREGVDAVHVSVWEWDGAVAAQVAHGVRDRPPRDRSATGGRGSDEEGLF